uniref:Uncharacterized protein n=1 Tax=Anopheles christyi TaxID=43041 RepID=A0A182K9K2_9DIPT
MSQDETDNLEAGKDGEEQVQNSPEQDVPMQTEESEPVADAESIQVTEKDFFKDAACIEVARCSWDRPIRQNYLQGCRLVTGRHVRSDGG